MASVEDYKCANLDQPLKHYYLPISYGLIFIVGLVGNVTSIGIYLTKMRPWKSSSIIMVNLALTDLLYVLSLPFLIHYYNNGELWTLGDFMCRFVRFGFHFNLYGSILFLTCIAIFRYVVVKKPLLAAQVQQKFWGIVACAIVWIIAAAEIAPMLTIISLKEHDNKTYCLDFASAIPINMHWYSWMLTVLGFLLPLAVVSMCYIGVVRQLAKGLNTSSPCRQRARHLTMLILVVFVVCFLPYHILRILQIEVQKRKKLGCMVYIVNMIYIFSRPLAGFITFFNLALYTLSGDKFRRAFLSTFYWDFWLTKATSLFHLSIISKAGSDLPAG